MPILDVESAADYVERLGYRARVRDWSLGHSLGIFNGRKGARAGDRDFDVHDAVVYIYPTADGWALNDSRVPQGDVARAQTLENAVEIALTRLGPPRDSA